MAKAKAATPAKTSKKAKDPLDDGSEDDLLATKGKKNGAAPAKKAAAKKAAPAKKAKAAKAKDTEGTVEDVRAILGKVKKYTSYSDIAEANNFDIRMVRRTARAMRDEGALELQREGAIVQVRRA